MPKSNNVRDIVRNFIIAGLILELVVSYSEVTGRDANRVEKNFIRRVRRGHPGLSAEYVEEEVIRLLAKELSCHYTQSPERVIEEIELNLRDVLSRNGKGGILSMFDWRFPTYAKQAP